MPGRAQASAGPPLHAVIDGAHGDPFFAGGSQSTGVTGGHRRDEDVVGRWPTRGIASSENKPGRGLPPDYAAAAGHAAVSVQHVIAARKDLWP
jgi:hypothetical protein